MKQLQYRRWKDFSLRMSQKGWSKQEINGKTHQEEVIPAVFNFFGLMESCCENDFSSIESWDDTVCDLVSEMLSDYNPYYWADEKSDKAYENWDEKWGGRIRACIRAGIDLAAEPSAGVLGFTKADIERMYPEGIPKWIQQPWEKKNGDYHTVKWEDIPRNGSLWL